MRIHNQQELLKFWEEIWGQVKPVWRRAFLKHDVIKEILTYQSDQIKVAVRRNQKLNDVLKDLHHQSQRKEEFDRKQNPFYDAEVRDQSPSKIEQREIEGGRWGRSF